MNGTQTGITPEQYRAQRKAHAEAISAAIVKADRERRGRAERMRAARYKRMLEARQAATAAARARQCRPVQRFDVATGQPVGEPYPSVADAAAAMGFWRNAVSEAIRKRRPCGGYRWAYADGFGPCERGRPDPLLWVEGGRTFPSRQAAIDWLARLWPELSPMGWRERLRRAWRKGCAVAPGVTLTRPPPARAAGRAGHTEAA